VFKKWVVTQDTFLTVIAFLNETFDQNCDHSFETVESKWWAIQSKIKGEKNNDRNKNWSVCRDYVTYLLFPYYYKRIISLPDCAQTVTKVYCFFTCLSG